MSHNNITHLNPPLLRQNPYSTHSQVPTPALPVCSQCIEEALESNDSLLQKVARVVANFLESIYEMLLPIIDFFVMKNPVLLPIQGPLNQINQDIQFDRQASSSPMQALSPITTTLNPQAPRIESQQEIEAKIRTCLANRKVNQINRMSATARPSVATTSYSPEKLAARREELLKNLHDKKIEKLNAPISASAPSIIPDFFESYWESWNMSNTNDYCALLTGMPMGTGVGKVNVATIAFGDYTFGTDQSGNMTIGFVNDQMSVASLKQNVQQVHSQGGKVKLSLGGATFSMSNAININATHDVQIQQAKTLAQNIAAVCQQDDLDGVDFDIEDGSIPGTIQAVVLQELRTLLGPDALISYTIPALSESSEPWHTVISTASQYITKLNVMCYDYYWTGYDPKGEFQNLINMGVQPNQIVWGIMPGYADDHNEFVRIDMAAAFTTYVLQNGLGGVMIWDANRDTNHRTGQPVNASNVYQTGMPDGSYITAISQAINDFYTNFYHVYPPNFSTGNTGFLPAPASHRNPYFGYPSQN